MRTYARNPVEFVRGEGTRLWDDEGNEYLDFLTGISVAQLGHCHPRVVEAVREQAGRLMHVGNLFYTEPGMRARRAARRSIARRRACSSATPAPRRTSARSSSPASAARAASSCVTERRLPRAHDGGAVGHAAGVQAGAVRAARAGLSGRAAQRRGRPARGRERATPPPSSSSRSRASRGSTRWTASCCTPPARPATSTAPLLIFDEIQCGKGRTGTLWALRAAAA